jgi:FkbH-like protein
MRATRKCLVWDLDETLWDGVCLEGAVKVKPHVVRTLKELDTRGILHSIASRNDEDLALRTLRQYGLEGFFLVPRINWLPKSRNILAIARDLGLSLDAMAFIDDDPFEREQVAYMLPEVLTIPAGRAGDLPDYPDFSPGTVTEEARQRRAMYRAEIERHQAEEKFATREEFLGWCAMRLSVRPMEGKDAARVAELMTRTHQLNTTGLQLGSDELEKLVHASDDGRRVFVAELVDRFGTYGIIGTAIVDRSCGRWRLMYFALSCRVMGRGIERAFLSALIRRATGVTPSTIEAEFRDTGRNRMMRAMYQMMNFRPPAGPEEDGSLVFRSIVPELPAPPPWVEVL